MRHYIMLFSNKSLISLLDKTTSEKYDYQIQRFIYIFVFNSNKKKFAEETKWL